MSLDESPHDSQSYPGPLLLHLGPINLLECFKHLGECFWPDADTFVGDTHYPEALLVTGGDNDLPSPALGELDSVIQQPVYDLSHVRAADG